jgi:hypothetical protein
MPRLPRSAPQIPGALARSFAPPQPRTLFGLRSEFAGLAAGFDKNYVAPSRRARFGFVEIGTRPPTAAGKTAPRIFCYQNKGPD